MKFFLILLFTFIFANTSVAAAENKKTWKDYWNQRSLTLFKNNIEKFKSDIVSRLNTNDQELLKNIKITNISGWKYPTASSRIINMPPIYLHKLMEVSIEYALLPYVVNEFSPNRLEVFQCFTKKIGSIPRSIFPSCSRKNLKLLNEFKSKHYKEQGSLVREGIEINFELALLFALTHEIGHIKLDHFKKKKTSRKDKEHEADIFAFTYFEEEQFSLINAVALVIALTSFDPNGKYPSGYCRFAKILSISELVAKDTFNLNQLSSEDDQLINSTFDSVATMVHRWNSKDIKTMNGMLNQFKDIFSEKDNCDY